MSFSAFRSRFKKYYEGQSKNRRQRGCLPYISHNSPNYYINLCTNTYCSDIRSFIPFEEKIFLLPDFKNNMFCHNGARWRWKHHVKMTPSQLIEIPYLYITPSLLCFSQYTWNRHYITWYLICSHLFEDIKLVLQSFNFSQLVSVFYCVKSIFCTSRCAVTFFSQF